MSTLVGMLLDGRYRLDELIGTGGMSTVYRAWDRRSSARSRSSSCTARSPPTWTELERFRRRGPRMVAQLPHPNVVTVIDAGEDNQRPYIVFEYVQGETLKVRIRRWRLDIPEAAAYAIEIARALGAAHAAHIVHRDVKPQNVLIDAEGSAKVTDLGSLTARRGGPDRRGPRAGDDRLRLPRAGAGPRRDGPVRLYSLGIVLFEMLTGDVPFRGENQVAVAMKHVREQVPDVQWRRPEVSAALAAVVDRATDSGLDPPYSTADEMIWDLEDALAVEAARSGQATGEATSVLRACRIRQAPGRPQHAPLRRGSSARLPPWPAWTWSRSCSSASLTAPSAVLASPSVPSGPHRACRAISLGQTAAGDYDPIGGDGEHPEETTFVVDRDRSTT